MYHDVIMAGFGGQGILLIGDILALAGMLRRQARFLDAGVRR